MSAASRKDALEALADEYGISLSDNNSGARDLARALEAPEKISKWCAVTERDGTSYLYPDCESEEEAKGRAEEHRQDVTFHEIPVAVANLDTGEAFSAEVGVITWRKERAEEVSPEERALRLLQARGSKKWRVYLADTGGATTVCAVERFDEEESGAPYAWITGTEEGADPFLVCIFTRERWAEPLTSREVGVDELPDYVFGELERFEIERGMSK